MSSALFHNMHSNKYSQSIIIHPFSVMFLVYRVKIAELYLSKVKVLYIVPIHDIPKLALLLVFHTIGQWASTRRFVG